MQTPFVLPGRRMEGVSPTSFQYVCRPPSALSGRFRPASASVETAVQNYNFFPIWQEKLSKGAETGIPMVHL